MIFETNKDKGRAGMALAIGYFGANGYTVNIPLNDTQWYDLVIEKDGIFQTVQCKATGSVDNTINLKSSGGTAGTAYDNVLNHPIDLLFCINQKQEIFIIPVEAIRNNGNTKSITLRSTPTANGQGFQTYKYKVSFFNTEKSQNIEFIQNDTNTDHKNFTKHFCSECGKQVSKKGVKCISCTKKKPIDEMPISRELLKNAIRNKPFTKIGEDYQVTDNSIRKWCKKYNLPHTKTVINSYSDEEWELI